MDGRVTQETFIAITIRNSKGRLTEYKIQTTPWEREIGDKIKQDGKTYTVELVDTHKGRIVEDMNEKVHETNRLNKEEWEAGAADRAKRDAEIDEQVRKGRALVGDKHFEDVLQTVYKHLPNKYKK